MPDEATFPRSAIGDILSLVTTQLATALDWASTRIIVTALDWDEAPHLSAEADILLRPSSEAPMHAREGGGRAVNTRDRTLKLALRTRFHADLAGGDVLKFNRASVGHFALEDAISDAMESFCAHEDSDTELSILALPLLIGAWSEARRSGGKGTMHQKSGWLMSWAPVSVRYLRNLAQP